MPRTSKWQQASPARKRRITMETKSALYPFCCGNCGVTEVGTEAPEGWVYSEVVDAGPLAPKEYSYWLCEGCSYDVASGRD